MIENLVSPFRTLTLMAVLFSGGIYGSSKVDMPDEIITAYRKAIQINPKMADAHYNLGIAYNNRTMVDEAIAALKRLRKLIQTIRMHSYNWACFTWRKVVGKMQLLRSNP